VVKGEKEKNNSGLIELRQLDRAWHSKSYVKSPRNQASGRKMLSIDGRYRRKGLI